MHGILFCGILWVSKEPTTKTTMKPKIRRYTYSTAYSNKNFSIIVIKAKTVGNVNMMSFNIGDEVSTVLVDRNEAAYSLRKFKKSLDSHRKSAKVIAP